MSFWSLSTGETAKTDGNAEMGGGNLPPIPEGTKVRAMVTEAKWQDANEYNPRHISLRWDVVDGEYKKRVIFQKVKVTETDANKRDKAIRMLAAIDTNCGGKLMALGREPSDMDMMANLCNKPMLIKLGVWEMEGSDGQPRSGNWVMAVQSANPSSAPQSQPEPTTSTETQNPATEKMDNDIGF